MKRTDLRCLPVAIGLLLASAATPPALPGANSDEGKGTAPLVRVRVGYFPNLTHAQALIGLGNGTFAKGLGVGARIEPIAFDAGPAAVEALFAGELDLVYLGANPAVNAFVRSKGEAIRVIAGASSGGARLIVRPAAGIHSPADLRGKKLATPQMGNTQDVAARAWLLTIGLKSRDRGGEVDVIPAKNADQLSLFRRGDLDAAWTVEPWASRLVHEAGGKELLDERTLWPERRFATTLLAARPGFLKEHPQLVRNWLKVHVELTDWVLSHPAQAKSEINRQLDKLTGKRLSPQVMDEAFAHLDLTCDPLPKTVAKSAESAFALGFLGGERPKLEGLFDLRILEEVRAELKTTSSKERR